MDNILGLIHELALLATNTALFAATQPCTDAPSFIQLFFSLYVPISYPRDRTRLRGNQGGTPSLAGWRSRR